MKGSFPINGSGLGFRRAMLGSLGDAEHIPVDFFEIAPENWIQVGGRLGKAFRSFTEQFPFIAHGLSLSLGGLEPLDETFLQKLKAFFNQHQIRLYSEHLSYCTGEGHLYDLMPIPFTEEAVKHVAKRIKRTQDILEQRIAIENVSFYAAPQPEMTELQFLLAVLDEVDCDLLLDVNNVYVNSINHQYDPIAFLDAIPAERIVYGHIAGHYEEAKDLIVDTHGADVIDPVWALLHETYRKKGVFPTLLERDFNFPPIAEMFAEVEQIRSIQKMYQTPVSQSA